MNFDASIDLRAPSLAPHGDAGAPVALAPTSYLSFPHNDSLSGSAASGDAGLASLVCSLQPHHAFAITHGGEIAAAGRAGRRMATALGFGEAPAARIVRIITEAGTNMLKHAGGGRLFVTEARSGQVRGIEIVAIDSGPGIASVSRAMQDGVSSIGAAGKGLGAMREFSDEFDAYAPEGKGAAFFMRLWNGEPARSRCSIGALCNPIASEDECGDAWAVAIHPAGVTMMAVDGLGHGPVAASAARAALLSLAAQPDLQPRLQIEACHQALRDTAGAALAVASLDFGSQKVCFAGIGNISACISEGEGHKQMVSYNGTVGHNLRKVREFMHPCPQGSLVILHSDGVNHRWDLADYPGLSGCHPALIAAVLLRDFRRTADDAQVLVIRFNEDA